MKSSKNPWLGLKTYEEGDVIYGRAQEINELSQDILYNVQTVIYGKSGIGKSSILNAGIFPIIRRHNYFPVKIRLVHRKTQLSYTEQIYSAVFENLKALQKQVLDAEGKTVRKTVEGSYRELVPAINKEHEGLWEFFHRHEFYDENGTPIKPILVIDQFEEIFTLTAETERAQIVKLFFNELADLINDIKPDYIYQAQEQDKVESSVANTVHETIDSDNDDLLYEEEEEEIAVDKNRYLTENNCHIVISIREDFLSYLERNIDNIPLLKHNRFCLKPLSEDQAANVIMNPCPGLISVSVAKNIISKITGVDSDLFEINDIPEIEVDSAILSLFLSEIYNKAEEGIITKEIVEAYGEDIIQRFYERTIQKVSTNCIEYLERRLITDEGRRDNIDKNRALRHAVTQAELDILKEARLVREFPWNNEMRIEFIHDVLCDIIVQRREERKKRKQKEEEEMQFRLKTEQLKRRNRQLVGSIIGIIVSLIVLAGIIWDGMYREFETRYDMVVKRNGWFEGLTKLSKDEATYRQCHYILKKKGRWSRHAQAMEARDGYGRLTTNHGMTPYILDKFDYTDKGADDAMKEKLLQVCKWEFIADKDGDFVIQEQALDKDGNLVYSYNKSKTKDKNKVISTYTDEYGFPIILRDSCYFYLLTTYSEDGFEILQEYYNDKGEPIPNKDGGYQTRWTHTSKGVRISEASLFFTGERMIDRFGNCGWVHTKYLNKDSIYATESMFFNADSMPSPTTLNISGGGVIMKRYEYDKHCRKVKETYWDDKGNPCLDYMGIHGLRYEYNRYGQQTHCYRIDTLGNNIKDKDGFMDYHREYDKYGNLIVDEMIVSEDTIINGNRFKYDHKKLLLEHIRYDAIYNGDTVYVYREINDTTNRVILKFFYDDSEPCTVRTTYDDRNNKISWSYYDITNTIPIELYGYHKTMYDYQYEDKKTTCTTSYYDKDGYRCNENGNKYWSSRVIKNDSVLQTSEELYYDSLNYFVLGVRYYYTDGFTKWRRTESISEDLRIKRAKNNRYFYYSANVINSVKPSNNKPFANYFLNEFDEPSLVYAWNEEIQSYGAFHAELYETESSKARYFDERGEEIDPVAYANSLIRVPVCETISLNKIGFKDGDVILKCDEWEMDFESPNPFADLNQWFKQEARKFYVARYNPDTRRYDVVTIRVDKNTNISAFVNLRILYCTDKETKRLKEVYATIKSGDIEDPVGTEEAVVTHSVVCCRIEDDGQMRDLGYKEGEFFALKWCDWTHEQSIDEFSAEFVQEKENSKTVVLLPFKRVNGEYVFGDVLHLELTAKTLGMRLFDSSVTEQFYQTEIKQRYDKWVEMKQAH